MCSLSFVVDLSGGTFFSAYRELLGLTPVGGLLAVCPFASCLSEMLMSPSSLRLLWTWSLRLLLSSFNTFRALYFLLAFLISVGKSAKIYFLFPWAAFWSFSLLV